MKKNAFFSILIISLLTAGCSAGMVPNPSETPEPVLRLTNAPERLVTPTAAIDEGAKFIEQLSNIVATPTPYAKKANADIKTPTPTCTPTPTIANTPSIPPEETVVMVVDRPVEFTAKGSIMADAYLYAEHNYTSAKKRVMKKGEPVKICLEYLSSDGILWYGITEGGTVCWVSAEYVRLTDDTVSPSPTTLPTEKGAEIAENITTHAITKTPTKVSTQVPECTNTPVPKASPSVVPTITNLPTPTCTLTPTTTSIPCTNTPTPTPDLEPDKIIKYNANGYLMARTILYGDHDYTSTQKRILEKNEQLQIHHKYLSTDGVLWYRITVGTSVGWVSADYVMPGTTTPTPTATSTPTPAKPTNTPRPQIPAHSYAAYLPTACVTISPTPEIPASYKKIESDITNDGGIFWISSSKTYSSKTYGDFVVEELYADKRTDLGFYTSVFYADKTRIEYNTLEKSVYWYNTDGTYKVIEDYSPYYAITTYDKYKRIIEKSYISEEWSPIQKRYFYFRVFETYYYETDSADYFAKTSYKLFANAVNVIKPKLSCFRLDSAYVPVIKHNYNKNYDYMELELASGEIAIIYKDLIDYVTGEKK